MKQNNRCISATIILLFYTTSRSDGSGATRTSPVKNPNVAREELKSRPRTNYKLLADDF
ncbi:MAG: hypothetical protein RR303_02135 [Bacteroidales bacterium]